MDVLTTAWLSRGAPRTVGRSLDGSCARCGRDDLDLITVDAVVSRVFTGFDGWRDPCGLGLCPACSWGYRAPELRTVNHLVTADPPSLKQLDVTALGDLLTTPLRADVAVVVPLRPVRKHLFPTAVWGRVTVDDAHLPWTTADTVRLAAMHRLRAAGFGSRMLAEPAPPWPMLRRLPAGQWVQTLDDWRALGPWRSRRPWFDLAVRASHPPTRPAV